MTNVLDSVSFKPCRLNIELFIYVFIIIYKQLQVETNVAVQISFYNERLAAWEPLLEPIIEGNETTMWEVQLKV